MWKYLILIILSFIAFNCRRSAKHEEPAKHADKIKIEADNYYPRWIKDNHYSGNQTSGIAFIGLDKSGNKSFLIADDIGEIYRFTIEQDTEPAFPAGRFVLTPINFSSNVQTFLDTFPKKDFEEILFDRHTNSVYLSIEGNNPNPKNFAGIYKIYFKNGDVHSDSINLMEKLNIVPDEIFKKFISDNIGYEGLAADEKYFYLGLEGFSDKGVFSDSTIILIVDKNDMKIVKEISTKLFSIYTICGLFSDSAYSLYGIDRNNKSLFRIKFDEKLNIISYAATKIETNIPNFPSIDYVASIEAVTMDDEKNIFMTDDPWKQYFIPSQEILNKLDSNTTLNFKNYIPIIHKFKISAKGRSASGRN